MSTRPRARWLFVESPSRSFCLSMIFFGKPVPPFPDHALDLPHHAWLARRAFQRIAVPLRGIGRGVIGALQKFEQCLIRPCGRAYRVIGQDEFAERFAE